MLSSHGKTQFAESTNSPRSIYWNSNMTARQQNFHDSTGSQYPEKTWAQRQLN